MRMASRRDFWKCLEDAGDELVIGDGDGGKSKSGVGCGNSLVKWLWKGRSRRWAEAEAGASWRELLVLEVGEVKCGGLSGS
ncbi:hypothetical protein GYMLUDRAFT_915209 [Collybiopsis luxurians FD-317 M1]|nr:hypothetical protein GYMLUDRAFT_915209 [Collybiopsis luxurians FD-317 M1]